MECAVRARRKKKHINKNLDKITIVQNDENNDV